MVWNPSARHFRVCCNLEPNKKAMNIWSDMPFAPDICIRALIVYNRLKSCKVASIVSKVTSIAI